MTKVQLRSPNVNDVFAVIGAGNRCARDAGSPEVLAMAAGTAAPPILPQVPMTPSQAGRQAGSQTSSPDCFSLLMFAWR